MECAEQPVLALFAAASLLAPVLLVSTRHAGFLVAGAVVAFTLSLVPTEGCGVRPVVAAVSLFSVMLSFIAALAAAPPRGLSVEVVVYPAVAWVLTVVAAGALAAEGSVSVSLASTVSLGTLVSALVYVIYGAVRGTARRARYVVG